MRVVGMIEARMGSSRLPGKTLTEIYRGMPLLECVIRRFRMAERVDDIVVATTQEAGDDPIADWCTFNRISLFRGSENDVLDRVVGAANQFGADAIVQMGADSAYLDCELVDQLVKCYIQGGHDYVCNDLKLTYPLGIYAHVVNVSKLTELNRSASLSSEDREDVVRYIWEHPKKYDIYNIEASSRFAYPQLRLTVDYSEDLELAIKLYQYFDGYSFTTLDIINLYKDQPEIFADVKNLVQQSAPFIVEGY